jgi:hypothetical protein
MVLAGGVLFAGCSSSSLGPGNPGTGGTGIPCGNANPDPCICGRPEASAQAAAQCQGEMDCEADGGVWNPFTMSDGDGGAVPPHCDPRMIDGGPIPLDGPSDDGNAAD